LITTIKKNNNYDKLFRKFRLYILDKFNEYIPVANYFGIDNF